MNKFKFVGFIFLFILLFCVIGSFFINNGEEIVLNEDIINIQNKINDKINIYGYTFDNMNVIVNPYDMNYNTALIMFETDDEVSINVNVNNLYSYSSKVTNRHYIGVYDLNVGDNVITLKYGNNTKKININIPELGDIIDKNNMIILNNNHFIMPTYEYIRDNVYTGFREVDILGKIYFEYIIDTGYKGLSVQVDYDKLAVLSDKLLIIDLQNGNVIQSFDIDNYDYNSITYKDNKIVLSSLNNEFSIDYVGNIDSKEYFEGDINYKLGNAVRFYKEKETEVSKENILLLSYEKDFDKDIKIEKEFNRIIINYDEVDNCNTYLILDKFMDKRIYNLCDKVNYIYTKNLSGKYSIYFKIDDKIYKTGKYLNFN